jgi:ATP/ADP translocase
MELAGVSSVLSIAPFLTPIVLAAVLCWIIAISYLHQKRLQSQTN